MLPFTFICELQDRCSHTLCQQQMVLRTFWLSLHEHMHRTASPVTIQTEAARLLQNSHDCQQPNQDQPKSKQKACRSSCGGAYETLVRVVHKSATSEKRNGETSCLNCTVYEPKQQCMDTTQSDLYKVLCLSPVLPHCWPLLQPVTVIMSALKRTQIHSDIKLYGAYETPP